MKRFFDQFLSQCRTTVIEANTLSPFVLKQIETCVKRHRPVVPFLTAEEKKAAAAIPRSPIVGLVDYAMSIGQNTPLKSIKSSFVQLRIKLTATTSVTDVFYALSPLCSGAPYLVVLDAEPHLPLVQILLYRFANHPTFSIKTSIFEIPLSNSVILFTLMGVSLTTSLCNASHVWSQDRIFLSPSLYTRCLGLLKNDVNAVNCINYIFS